MCFHSSNVQHWFFPYFRLLSTSSDATTEYPAHERSTWRSSLIHTRRGVCHSSDDGLARQYATLLSTDIDTVQSRTTHALASVSSSVALGYLYDVGSIATFTIVQCSTYVRVSLPIDDTLDHTFLAQALSALQLARRAPRAYLPLFEWSEHALGMIDNQKDSFLVSVYQQCLSGLSQKWKISIPLVDYNLARLYQCARQCLALWQQQQRQENLQLAAPSPLTATFSIEELPLALEFYLQIDGRRYLLLNDNSDIARLHSLVDLFYLKTCSFRGAIPVEESIFCAKTPEICYSISACQERSCHSCRPWHIRQDAEFDRAVPYDLRRVHQFVNGYRAILNCPAVRKRRSSISSERYFRSHARRPILSMLWRVPVENSITLAPRLSLFTNALPCIAGKVIVSYESSYLDCSPPTVFDKVASQTRKSTWKKYRLSFSRWLQWSAERSTMALSAHRSMSSCHSGVSWC